MQTIHRTLLAALLLLWAARALAVDRTPPFARSLTMNLGLQGRVIWVDATANIDRIRTIEGVRDLVDHCKRANITTIVVDVKPVVGEVIYNSRIAPHLTTWRGKTYPDFDTLGAFIQEAHKVGIEVAATFNVLGEGHKMFKAGLAYRKPEWQAVSYIVERSLVAADGAKLLVRDSTEPDDPQRTLVQGDDAIVSASAAPGASLAVLLDDQQQVAGVIDPALLDGEPLAPPEDGNLMVLGGQAVDWASSHLRAGDHDRFDAIGRRVPITEAPNEKVAAFVNPLQPDARAYEVSLLEEVARNYDVDAIVFDRLRYANIYSDYSDISRAAFERWLGRPVRRWPEDVVQFNPVPGTPVRKGPYYKQWLEFRARVIHDFVSEVTARIRRIKPRMRFGAYVGSWYTEYYGVGVNWGSEKYPFKASWATPTYPQSGYAEFLDWLCTGCYYPIPTRDEARALGREEGGTVEAAADLSTAAVANSVPVYAGLYLLNYQGRPDAFQRAVTAALRHSQGVMVFDASYVYDYNWWPLLEQALARPAFAPHQDDALTQQLRSAEDAVRITTEARGTAARMPAVPYQPGGG